MAYLLDTNVLLRVAQPRHPMHREATRCIQKLIASNEAVHIVPQVVFEFWVVATRPMEHNGLGFAPEVARRKIARAESIFQLKPDVQTIYTEWLRIIQTFAVSGLAAHDARMVAAMKVHRISHLVTFNIQDFKRYQQSEIIVQSPLDVLSS